MRRKDIRACFSSRRFAGLASRFFLTQRTPCAAKIFTHAFLRGTSRAWRADFFSRKGRHAPQRYSRMLFFAALRGLGEPIFSHAKDAMRRKDIHACFSSRHFAGLASRFFLSQRAQCAAKKTIPFLARLPFHKRDFLRRQATTP